MLLGERKPLGASQNLLTSQNESCSTRCGCVILDPCFLLWCRLRSQGARFSWDRCRPIEANMFGSSQREMGWKFRAHCTSGPELRHSPNFGTFDILLPHMVVALWDFRYRSWESEGTVVRLRPCCLGCVAVRVTLRFPWIDTDLPGCQGHWHHEVWSSARHKTSHWEAPVEFGLGLFS